MACDAGVYAREAVHFVTFLTLRRAEGEKQGRLASQTPLSQHMDARRALLATALGVRHREDDCDDDEREAADTGDHEEVDGHDGGAPPRVRALQREDEALDDLQRDGGDDAEDGERAHDLAGRLVSLAASVTELVRISSAGQGLSALLARAGELTGVPLVIIDNAYRIMACTKSFGDIGPTYAAIMSKGRISASVVEAMNEARVYQTMRYFKDLCLFENSDDGTYWLNRLIYVDDVEVAHFGAVVDPDDPLRHYPLISFLCELIAIELQKESFFAYGSNVMADVLMRELIDGTATEERIKIAVDRLGWTVPERMEVLVVAAKSGMIERSHAYAVARRLTEGRRDSHQAFLDGRMVIIEPMPGGKAAWPVEANAAHGELVGILESEGLVAAISDPFTGLNDAARAHAQAMRAWAAIGSIPSRRSCATTMTQTARPSRFTCIATRSSTASAASATAMDSILTTASSACGS